MIYKCLVIDDDFSAIEILTDYINLQPNLDLIKSFNDPTEVIAFVENKNLDVIFLDIELPQMSGIELARILKDKKSKIVFTTSHIKYGYDAFQLDVEEYLLKPISYLKFTKTIDKLFPKNTPIKINSVLLKDSFFVKNAKEKHKLIKVYFTDVIAFESVQHYVKIYTTTTVITAYLTLSEVRSMIAEQKIFIQVHRSFLISENHIESIQGNNIHLANKIVIPIGNNFKEIFLSIIYKNQLKNGRNL